MKKLVHNLEEFKKLKNGFHPSDFKVYTKGFPKMYPCVVVVENEIHLTTQNSIYFTFVYQKDFQ